MVAGSSLVETFNSNFFAWGKISAGTLSAEIPSKKDESRGQARNRCWSFGKAKILLRISLLSSAFDLGPTQRVLSCVVHNRDIMSAGDTSKATSNASTLR